MGKQTLRWGEVESRTRGAGDPFESVRRIGRRLTRTLTNDSPPVHPTPPSRGTPHMKPQLPLLATLCLAGLPLFAGCSKESQAAAESNASAAAQKAKSAVASGVSDLQKSSNEALAAIDQKLSELKTEAPEKAQAMYDKLKGDLAALKKSAEDAAARFK